jgi:hypothetical protein
VRQNENDVSLIDQFRMKCEGGNILVKEGASSYLRMRRKGGRALDLCFCVWCMGLTRARRRPSLLHWVTAPITWGSSPIATGNRTLAIDSIHRTSLTAMEVSFCLFMFYSYASPSHPSRPTWGIASLRRSNYGLYPRSIHRWENASRRAVGPRWHNDVAYTIV